MHNSFSMPFKNITQAHASQICFSRFQTRFLQCHLFGIACSKHLATSADVQYDHLEYLRVLNTTIINARDQRIFLACTTSPKF